MGRDSLKYLDAASLLLTNGPVNEANWPDLWQPILFLLCHAMELSMKARLAFVDDLRDYHHHDVSRLMVSCLEKRIVLSNDFQHACGHMQDKGVDFRFTKIKGIALMWPGTLLKCIEPQIRESYWVLYAELTEAGNRLNIDEAELL